MLMPLPDERQSYDLSSVFIWAERDTRARFVVDDDLNIEWSNDAAARFLDETESFSCFAGALLIRANTSRQRFLTFVRSSSPDLSTLCLQDETRGYILCTAMNLTRSGGHSKTGITLRKSGHVVPIGLDYLKVAFQFTTCERNVVRTLFAGQTAEEVGEELHLSLGTIRMHIRHIYDKMNVSSREAMFHKLMPFMLAQ